MRSCLGGIHLRGILSRESRAKHSVVSEKDTLNTSGRTGSISLTSMLNTQLYWLKMHTEARKTDLWAEIPGFLKSPGIHFRKASRGLPDSASSFATRTLILKALLTPLPSGKLPKHFHKTISRTQRSHRSISFSKHLNFHKCRIYILKIYTFQQHWKEIGYTEYHHQQEIPKTSGQQILEEMPVCLPKHKETDMLYVYVYIYIFF